jgi:hypothetical protein
MQQGAAAEAHGLRRLHHLIGLSGCDPEATMVYSGYTRPAPPPKACASACAGPRAAWSAADSALGVHALV